MKILKTITEHINGRYKIDESDIIGCLDVELMSLEERSRDCEDTLFYIESYDYKMSLYDMFMDVIWTKNEKAKDEELKEWTEGLVDSIIPDEFIDYYFERIREIRLKRHRDNLFYEYKDWLKEIDSKYISVYNIHPEILSFVRSEMYYRRNLLDGGYTERNQFIDGILDNVRDSKNWVDTLFMKDDELSTKDIKRKSKMTETLSKYVEEIDKTGMLEPVIL